MYKYMRIRMYRKIVVFTPKYVQRCPLCYILYLLLCDAIFARYTGIYMYVHVVFNSAVPKRIFKRLKMYIINLRYI